MTKLIDNNPNLFKLGVPIRQQSELPNPDSFPSAFNQNAFKYWQQAVDEVKVKSPKLAWPRAIQRFVRLCEQYSIFPFYDQQTNNDLIFTALLRGRRQVVRFMDSTKLLDEMRPDRTSRSVTMTTTGFTLTVESQVRLMVNDPTIVQKMGLREAAKTTSGSIWKRSLDRDVEFFIRNSGANLSQRWFFGYTLTIPVFPHIPGNHTPSTKELEKFVMDIIYLPILRAFRPLKSNNRLI